MHRYLQGLAYLVATALLAGAFFATPFVGAAAHEGQSVLPGASILVMLALAGLALAVGVVMIASWSPDRPVRLKPKR